MNKCPYCAEEIQDDAVKCKHCGEWLNSRETQGTNNQTKETHNESRVYSKSKKSSFFSTKISAITFKRLGLCFGAMLLLIVYASAAATIRLNYYVPIGLFLMSVYSWIVIRKLKGIYPTPSRASGQLCITFLILTLSNSNQINQMKHTIEQSSVTNQDALIYTLAFHEAIRSIAGLMFFGLLVTYIVSKKKKRI